MVSLFLSEVVCRYEFINQIMSNHNELDPNEAYDYLGKLNILHTLTTTYNLKANGKIKCGNNPIVKGLWKPSDGKVREWRQLRHICIDVFNNIVESLSTKTS